MEALVGGVRRDGSLGTELSRTERSVALLPPRDGLAIGEGSVLVGDGKGWTGAVWHMGEFITASRTGSKAGIAEDSSEHGFHNLNRCRTEARARRRARPRR